MSVKNRLKKQSRKIWFKETQEKSNVWGVSIIKFRKLKNKEVKLENDNKLKEENKND